MDPLICFLVGGVALVLLAVGRLRAGAVVQTGRIRVADVNDFSLRAAALVVLVAGALGAIAWLAPRADCIRLFRLNDPASLAATLVVLLAGIVIVRWVWGPGGEFLATSAGMFHRGPKREEVEYNPIVLRLVITHLVVLGLVIAWLSAAGSAPPAACLSAGYRAHASDCGQALWHHAGHQTAATDAQSFARQDDLCPHFAKSAHSASSSWA